MSGATYSWPQYLHDTSSVLLLLLLLLHGHLGSPFRRLCLVSRPRASLAVVSVRMVLHLRPAGIWLFGVTFWDLERTTQLVAWSDALDNKQENRRKGCNNGREV